VVWLRPASGGPIVAAAAAADYHPLSPWHLAVTRQVAGDMAAALSTRGASQRRGQGQNHSTHPLAVALLGFTRR